MKSFVKILLALLVLGCAFPALAQVDGGAVLDAAAAAHPLPPDTPASLDDAWGLSQYIFGAFKAGEPRLGVSALLMLFIYLWRRFGSRFLIGKLPSKYLPLLTLGVGYLASVPIELMKPDFSWSSFVLNGLLLSAPAMALWSTIFKFWLPDPEKK